nr:hypothetical protein [uncultured bacterium]
MDSLEKLDYFFKGSAFWIGVFLSFVKKDMPSFVPVPFQLE